MPTVDVVAQLDEEPNRGALKDVPRLLREADTRIRSVKMHGVAATLDSNNDVVDWRVEFTLDVDPGAEADAPALVQDIVTSETGIVATLWRTAVEEVSTGFETSREVAADVADTALAGVDRVAATATKVGKGALLLVLAYAAFRVLRMVAK